jgi:hypothetical protein
MSHQAYGTLRGPVSVTCCRVAVEENNQIRVSVLLGLRQNPPGGPVKVIIHTLFCTDCTRPLRPRRAMLSCGRSINAHLPAVTRFARAMSSSALPLQPPSLEEETLEFKERTAEMAQFFALPRFKGTKRPYSPAEVASKQGSLPVLPLPSTLLADKLYKLFTKAAEAGQPVHTLGAIDPVQMTQMAEHQEVVYISGWAASSVLTTGNNDVGPDLG